MSNDEQQTGRHAGIDGHMGRQTGGKARRDAGREADKGNETDRQSDGKDSREGLKRNLEETQSSKRIGASSELLLLLEEDS